MNSSYLVRTGLFGQLGYFECDSNCRVAPREQAICRTERGLEVGEIIATDFAQPDGWNCLGRVLRPITEQDRMIIDRLERFKQRAVASCEKLLSQKGIKARLLDAEHLFDGRNLIFYFWDECDPAVDFVLDELAELYDRRVGFSRFATRLAEGCGPGCGTTKTGCAGGGCSTCSTGGCGIKPKPGYV